MLSNWQALSRAERATRTFIAFLLLCIIMTMALVELDLIVFA